MVTPGSMYAWDPPEGGVDLQPCQRGEMIEHPLRQRCQAVVRHHAFGGDNRRSNTRQKKHVGLGMG